MNANKLKQLQIINKYNPMHDDYHVGIRSVSDINTFKEAVEKSMDDFNQYGKYSSYPDITNSIIENALKNGIINVYSSYPILPGTFVTPSKMQAKDYSGGEQIYNKKVNINDVAWINIDEGQYAPI